jgi:prepilin-type N-terminal cleavage/methylation domain-containing protein
VGSKSNRAFSLLEVIITVAILATAIVFIFQGFSAVLSSITLSQNITQACFLSEDKLWKLENDFPLSDSLWEEAPYDKFSYTYESADTQINDLKQLKVLVSWPQKREKPYSLEFITYKLLKNK